MMRATQIKEAIEVALRGDHLSAVSGNEDNVASLIRMAINAENEAVILYQKIADATDNEFVAKVFLDVADEEKVHIGEFFKLLSEVEPNEVDFYMDGTDEVQDEIQGELS